MDELDAQNHIPDLIESTNELLSRINFLLEIDQLSSAAKIAAIASAFIVLLAIYFAVRTSRQELKNARKISRLSNTINLLVQLQTDPAWVQQRLQFIKLRDTKEGLERFAEQDSEEAVCIRRQLNIYELIAIGIAKATLDDETMERFYRGTVLKDWDRSKNFIKSERGENSKYWLEFEEMAMRYGNNHGHRLESNLFFRRHGK